MMVTRPKKNNIKISANYPLDLRYVGGRLRPSDRSASTKFRHQPYLHFLDFQLCSRFIPNIKFLRNVSLHVHLGNFNLNP